MHIATLDDVIFIDIPNTNALIHYDEGYSFGISFFETILVTHHGIFLDKHVQRINRSLEEFNISQRISVELIENIIRHYKLSTTALKLQVSEKNIIASVRGLTYSPDYYQRGAHVTLSKFVRSRHSPLIHHKSANYGDLILALRQAKHDGFDDCLLFNERGNLTESCIANLFILKDDTIITPPLSDGLLPGIIRDYLIHHYTIIEQSLTLNDLMHCDGAFLTNSLMGIVHIDKVNNTSLPLHPMIKKMAHHYFQMIQKEL